MNRLGLALVLIAIGAIGLGFYLGWFHIGSDRVGSKTLVTLTIDWDRIGATQDKAVDVVEPAD